MISYVSSLKFHQQGRTDIIAVIEQLQHEGYEYLWWDWLVIINSKWPQPSNYKQAEFEQTMMWATNHSAVIAIAWPTYPSAYAYLERPWCVAELLCATRRGVHRIYSREENPMPMASVLIIKLAFVSFLLMISFGLLGILLFIPVALALTEALDVGSIRVVVELLH